MMSVFEKASIRADVLQSAYNTMSWDMDNLRERIKTKKDLLSESIDESDESAARDREYQQSTLENMEYRMSIYNDIGKALEKLL